MRLTYRDLVRRLYDMERLAEPPLPGERGGCMSSYDRRSRYDAEADAYVDWDANDDGSGFVRREGEGGEWVVAFEQEGPGVIWRVWSALPGEGRIQIFIDGEAAPSVDMPFRAFFERFGGETPPLNLPSLAPTLSRGRNRFIPIPYQRSCVVRLGPGWGAYYHFTYGALPAGTELPRFTGAFDRDACLALAEADRLLARRGWAPPGPGEEAERVRVTVPAGGSVPALTLAGNRAIAGLRVALDLPAPPEDQRALRELALSIRWDGEAEPSVWAPLGDFFASAPGANPHRALPLGVTDGGLYARWFMPFASEAAIAIANDGDEPREIELTAVHRPLERPASELLRFHAKWHRDALLGRAQAQGRAIDWPILIVEGQGRFCGAHLHVYNRWPEPAEPAAEWWYGRWDKKSIDWWWGEGDEKFFVDGERFPSTFGTGSEDYVGYAWAAEPPFPTFESAYACQPYVAIDGNGHTSVCRLHVCDDVPFQSSFEAAIEKYKPNSWGEGAVCLYAATAFWYQRGGRDPYGPAGVAERLEMVAEPRA